MPWYMVILVSAGVAWLVLVVCLLVVMCSVTKNTGGFAPGWQLRCTRCGRTRDAGEAGLVRYKAASASKRTLGFCRGCRGFRWLAVERVPDEAEHHHGAQVQA